MGEQTARFELPFIVPGQAQKELFHNEALTRIDAALHPAVEQVGVSAPPASPALGKIWLVGADPAADWAGKANSLACWTEGGWRFVEPEAGMLVWNKPEGVWIYWTGTAWSGGELPASSIRIGGKKIIGERLPSVPSPSGGTVIDPEARAAVAAVIATLMSHGLID